ncbi:MAG: aminotransferase class V-fold PLP-dependent enzyme [Desulfobaccales bacterium]
MEQVGIARRDFLKGIAAAALTAGFIGPSEAKAFVDGGRCSHARDILPQNLQPYPVIKGHPGSEQFWDKVRQTFVLPDDYIHMNTGTTGSQPLFSLVNLGVYNLYKSEDPRDWQLNLNKDFPDLFAFDSSTATSALVKRQIAVANQYWANADEILLDYNTTDACNLIFAGTPWNKGDRIICTQWEHAAMTGPIAWARDYFDVEVRIVTLPTNFTKNISVQDVVDAFEVEFKQVPPGVKAYLATSEVFYKNGLRMPIKALCAKARSYGIFSIIDSAHGWGMLPVDCHGYGADFIAGAGHKWLCGGPGTGITYVRNSYDLPKYPLPPFNGGNWAAYGGSLFDPTTKSPRFVLGSQTVKRSWTPASLSSRGETNTPALYAMTDSAAYFGYIGVQAIRDRGVALGNYLKSKIAAQWPGALWVEQNNDPEFATALTAFNPFKERETTTALPAMSAAINGVSGVGGILNTLAGEDPKIYIRSVTFRALETGAHTYPTADNRITMRASTHGVYNNYQQVDYMFHRLVKAVEAAAAVNGLTLLQ